MNKSKTIRILGIRGLPAAHGGFETFAHHLAIYLRDRGWRVIVYCQVSPGEVSGTDVWNGIERILIPAADTSLGTIVFDFLSTIDAAKHHDLCLTLGYNTAIFSVWLRLRGVRNLINMDGIEWRRDKWGMIAKIWFWLNERAGCWLGDHLIADHPEIAIHLASRVSSKKITMIPYGGFVVDVADRSILLEYGVEAGKFVTLIARPEPENSILEIVEAFSRKPRGIKLLVLGKYTKTVDYHSLVLGCASGEVVFVGAVYDQERLKALRYYSLAYIHGHRVGGTNPSLVEALAAGNAVIAHDNRYNRWVAGDSAIYFSSADDLDRILGDLLVDDTHLVELRLAAKKRVDNELNWPSVFAKYEKLFCDFL